MTTDDELLRLENQLCFAMVTAARNVVAVYRPILEPLGLTHPQYLVMLALWGDAGFAQAAATPLDTWKNWASDVRGQPIPGGHFPCEENPQATAQALLDFFDGGR